MIRELSELVPTFGGAASQTRCFLHVVNLVAKSLICQFNVSKGFGDAVVGGGQDDEYGEAGFDENDDIASEKEANQNVVIDGIDNDDGWIDEVDLLSPEERKELDDAIQPVKTLLVKVCEHITTLAM